MEDVLDLRFLLVIRDNPTLVAAARCLGVTPSAVTQRLQQLERRLDVRLLDRSARRLRFTEEGELLCTRGREVLAQYDALREELLQRRLGAVGTLRISAPFGFGRRHVAPVVSAFQALHPEVEVVLTLAEQPLLAGDTRFDLMLHIGELRASSLVGYAIAPNRRLLCAAPGFIDRHGLPERPEDLARLPCVALRENGEDLSLWHFAKGRATRSVRVRSALMCNDGEVIRQWAEEGHGVILRSEWDVADALHAGRLIRLLPTWKVPDADIIALTHAREGQPARVGQFLRLLQERFRPAPPWRAARP